MNFKKKRQVFHYSILIGISSLNLHMGSVVLIPIQFHIFQKLRKQDKVTRTELQVMMVVSRSSSNIVSDINDGETEKEAKRGEHCRLYKGKSFDIFLWE